MSTNPYGQYSGLFNLSGKAANTLGGPGLGNTLGGAGNSLGVLSGLQQGGVGGYGSAGVNAGGLANKLGLLGDPTSGLNQGVGDLGNALGIYQGVQQGGVGGYGGAGVNAGQLATKAGLFGGTQGVLGQALGYAAIPLDLYNEAKNWQSGSTGSDALGGASTGAAIGSVVPGIGTAIGAGAGALVGALSSLLGPGKTDPETQMAKGLIDAVGAHPDQASAITSSVQNPYLQLAGLFDEKSSTLPMYQQYGRMGEQKFTDDLAGKLQAAQASGVIKPGEDPTQAYNDVIAPWVNSMGSGYKNVGQTYADTTQGLLEDMTQQYLGGQADKDWTSIGGQNTFSNIYGPPAAPAAAPQPVQNHSMLTGHTQLASEGGTMKSRKSALSALYKGSFADRKPQHYDDGGYVSYFGGAGSDYAPSDPTLQNFDINSELFDPQSSSYIGSGDNIVNQGNDPLGYGINPSPGAGSSTGTGKAAAAPSAIQQLLGSYGKYAALLPILGSLTGLTNPKQASAAAPPPGFSNGATNNFQVPSFNRTQTPVNPNTDWYTYGQHPETNFFQNNQLPYAPGVSPASQAPQAPAATQPQAGLQPLKGAVMAQGGALGTMFDSGAGDSYVNGPGDGTSDDIPAKLSDGEYVMDAGSVSMLGNGSNKAGAQALDRLRQNIRKHAGKKMVKGKQFMKSKPAESYLKGSGD